MRSGNRLDSSRLVAQRRVVGSETDNLHQNVSGVDREELLALQERLQSKIKVGKGLTARIEQAR